MEVFLRSQESARSRDGAATEKKAVEKRRAQCQAAFFRRPSPNLLFLLIFRNIGCCCPGEKSALPSPMPESLVGCAFPGSKARLLWPPPAGAWVKPASASASKPGSSCSLESGFAPGGPVGLGFCLPLAAASLDGWFAGGERGHVKGSPWSCSRIDNRTGDGTTLRAFRLPVPIAFC